ncbi:MAG: 16S rRNA (cytidine(1402)-2'-O)-methyltransferase [candidate division Zixibacteria bacterium]|nr:16S rRNA (cytidine(1402)-2'-O)-methyltransferase [candidate division Zixibacteria bacterium]
MQETPGTIYLVPTPIGNMGDVTARAAEVLASVDLVACEDTRNSGGLLKKLDIKKKLISYHEFNEIDRAQKLVDAVRGGQSVAVITDGGSPGISDPAYRVVRAAIDAKLNLVALPGPCAIIPALTASGLPTDRFFFEGFLPNKSAAREKRLTELETLPHTLIFYESPHRVHKSLAAMLEVYGDRNACLAREISKKFEQFIRGPLSEIIETIDNRTVKGEIVLIVAGTGMRRKKPSIE